MMIRRMREKENNNYENEEYLMNRELYLFKVSM
jgi:hypothetical protein